MLKRLSAELLATINYKHLTSHAVGVFNGRM